MFLDMRQPKKRSLLADMVRDMIDVAKTVMAPFADFAADINDAHTFSKHKRMLIDIQKKLLAQPKKMAPIVSAHSKKTTAFAVPKIAAWTARPQHPTLPPLPSIIIPAIIIGIPIAVFAFCDRCRKKTFSLFHAAFFFTTALGNQVRLDIWGIIHWTRSLIDAFHSVLPDRQTIRHTFIISVFNAKKSFAKFVLAARRLHFPSMTLPRVEFPHISLPKLLLPRISVPNIRLPQFHIPRFRIPHITVPHIAVSIPKLLRPSLPHIMIPRISLPTFSIPRLSFHKIHIPQFHVPRIALPVFKLPHLIIPRFKIPQLTIPRIVLNVPQFKLPHIKIPVFRIPQLKTPHFEMLIISLPRLRLPSFHLPLPKNERPFASFRLLYKNFLTAQARKPVLENNGGSNNRSFHLSSQRLKRIIPFWKKYYLTEFVALAVVAGTVGVFISIYAAANRTNLPIMYQGRLMDQNYVPKADVEHYIAFEIYDALAAGNCVWRTATLGSDTAGTCNGSDPEALAVTPSRGLFTVTLGTGVANSDNPEITNNFQTDDYYLQVKVCTTTGATSCETLAPRKQLGGVPYAYHAYTADTFNPPTTLTYTGDAGTVLTLTANSITTNNGIALSATALTSGSALALTGPSSGTGITGNFSSQTSYIGASGKLVNLVPTFASSSGGSSYGIYLNPVNSNSSSANTIYGIYATSTDAVALGNTNYGIYNALTNTGALTSATKTLYGDYISVSGTGASTSATTNVYGSYITTTATHSADSGTVNNYGLYIANGTSSTNGTSIKYGLYIAEPTGADTNYGAIIAGGFVGIGTISPGAALDVSTAAAEARYIRVNAPDSQLKGFQLYSNTTTLDWEVVSTATARLFSIGEIAGGNRLVINRSGVVMINGTAAYGRLGQLFEINTTANYGGQAINTWSTTADQGAIIDFQRSKSATIGTHTELVSGDTLGAVIFRGSDGSGFEDAASIKSHVDGTPGDNDMPGRLSFWTSPDGTITSLERMRIDNAGYIGIGTTAPTNILSLSGQSARTIWMERHTTANTAGNTLTLQAGGATSAATNKAGGALILAPGLSTGTGGSMVRIQGTTIATSSGTSDNSLVDRLVVTSPKVLTDGTATSLFNIALPSSTMCSGSLLFSIEATDGTDYQTRGGEMHFSAANKGGIFTTGTSHTPSNDATAISAGTLIPTWGMASTTDVITLQLNADTSLTSSTGFPRIIYTIFSNCVQAITIL